MKRIAIASDHAGYHLKETLKAHLASRGLDVTDFGTDSDAACDYPDFIRPAAQAVMHDKADAAIVLGGSGNGEAIVANKVRGIRCALCWSVETARLAREHNNANALSLGARMVTSEQAVAIVDAWLDASFEGGRHQQRIDKIEGAP